MSENGFIKRGDIIVTMTGYICCSNEECPHLNDIGCCTDINVQCKYSKQKVDAFLHYAFEGNKEVAIELR